MESFGEWKCSQSLTVLVKKSVIYPLKYVEISRKLENDEENLYILMMEEDWQELAHAMLHFKDCISARKYVGKDFMVYYHEHEAVLTCWKEEGVTNLVVTRIVLTSEEYWQLEKIMLPVASVLRGIKQQLPSPVKYASPFIFVYYTFGDSHGCYSDKTHYQKVADAWGERVHTHVRAIPPKSLLLYQVYTYLTQKRKEKYCRKHCIDQHTGKEQIELFMKSNDFAEISKWDIAILYINLLTFWKIDDASEYYLRMSDLENVLQSSVSHMLKARQWYVYRTILDALECKHHHKTEPTRKSLACCCV